MLVERNTQAPKSEEYPLMAFIGNEGVVEKGERYNRESLVSDSENKKYKRTEKGDFIYSSNNLETGSIGLNQYGNASISPVYSIFYPTEIADYNFLGRRLVRKDFINQMVKWRQGVIYGQWRIHEDDFLKIEIYAPQKREQEKIGDVFKYLDSLITLHQRKEFMRKLRKIKELLLNNLANDWEQRKFEECFDERRERTEMENEDTLLSCAINGMFLNSELFGHFRGTTTIGYLKVKKYDLILSAQNLHLGNANVNLRFEHGIISPAYKVYDLVDCEPNFVQAWVKKEDTKNFFLTATTEGASQCRKNIEWTTLGKQTILMPSLREQTAIGVFFKQFDNLITLHQCKYFYRYRSLGKESVICKGDKSTNDWEQRELWTLTIWDKKFNEVENEKQPKIIKYPYVLADVFKQIEDDSGNVLLLSTGSYVGYTTIEKASVNLCEGEIVAIPWGGTPNVKYYKGKFVTADNRIATSNDLKILSNKHLALWLQSHIKLLESLYRGASIKHPSMSDVLNLIIDVPAIVEQKKIADIIFKLDKLITLHQRKETKNRERKHVQIKMKVNKKMANAWEQREFGYYFFERNERSGNGEMISVTINSGIRKFSELNRHDTKPDDLSKYKKVEVGDIAYNSMRMWQGASGYSPYSGILSPAYTVISPKNGVSSRFFSYVLKQPRMIHLFEINSQGLTKDTWNLKYPAFAPIETVAPKTYEEQEKISGVLVKIDELITLHRCKYFNKISRKLSIQVMQKVCIETNTWEQREFSQLYTKVSEKNDLTYTTEQIISVANMYYKIDSYITDMEYLRTYNVFKLGDIAFEGNKSKDFAHGRFVENTIGNGIVSHVFDVFRPIMSNYSLLFWKYAINNERLMGKILVRCTKASTMMTNLVAVDFLKESFFVPTVDEQDKIGTLLDKIERLITLHQRE